MNLWHKKFNISISENGNSITPHSAARTLQKRMGDCKDKSALFFSMLKEIGVDAYPMLVATDRNKADVLTQPSMNVFNHMIVCFKLKDGKQSERQKRRYFGEYARHMRDNLMLMDLKQVQQQLKEDYKSNVDSKAKVLFDIDGPHQVVATSNIEKFNDFMHLLRQESPLNIYGKLN